MNNGWKSLALVLAGILLGACARQALVRDAAAQPSRGYLVVGGSLTADGYRNDLNKYGAEGWRFVGAIPVHGAPAMIVLEH